MSGIFNARKLRNIELNRLSVSEFKEAEKHPVHVVLDNIRSMLNVGSVFRTCDAFKVDTLHLCGITAKPPHRDITRSAIGAEASVNWAYHQSTKECLLLLKEEGVKIIGVEQMDNSLSLQDFNWPDFDSFAVVFGNEVDGISDEVVSLCDYFVEFHSLERNIH